jgi:hypothetical protein
MNDDARNHEREDEICHLSCKYFVPLYQTSGDKLGADFEVLFPNTFNHFLHLQGSFKS